MTAPRIVWLIYFITPLYVTSKRVRAAGDVKLAGHEKTAGRLHGPRRRAPCKPGFVRGRPPPAIYLIPRLRAGFSGRTRESAGRLILPYSTLLLMGFARPAGSPRGRWALTPPFHPYRFRGGLLFCGTFPGFAPAGISPASRPAEPGLSSRAARRRLARIL